MPVQQEVLPVRRKWRNILLLASAELFAMSLWFSASAVVPQLAAVWDLTSNLQSWLTMSVQIGFVVGTLVSALLNLPDRIFPSRLFSVSAFAGAMFNLAIPLLSKGPYSAIGFRFLTGFVLAGVYPVGMKITATWCRRDRGLGIGVLVGALTVGSGLPHLLHAFSPVSGNAWKGVLSAASLLAFLSALIAFFLVKCGPWHEAAPRFDWKLAGRTLKHRPTRLANFGYLGHMWELYAMWTWIPLFLSESFSVSGWDVSAARVIAFAVIAVGGAGCVLAGKLADRWGRTKVTISSLAVSGTCSLGIGLIFNHPLLLSMICLIWGLTVVSDSAQFSAAVSELCDRRYIGTALTIQTSMGFLLTMISIRLIPSLQSAFGWAWAFPILAVGPLIGILSMLRLRRLPEARLMASGKK